MGEGRGAMVLQGWMLHGMICSETGGLAAVLWLV